MITITHIDTACLLLDIHGYKILTDPTLDRAGKLYHHGYGTFSRKTSNPAISPAALGQVDLVLLSHHQHKDNFDKAGRELTATIPLVLSTQAAARSLPGVMGLDDWEHYEISTPLVPGLRITATPARHHPWWLPEFFAGKVIGFVIECEALTDGVIYISGDTVYFNGIRQVASRFNVDIGIFHMGAVQFPYLTGKGHYTMDGKGLIKAASDLTPNRIIPVHYSGWTHFKENEPALRKVLATAPDVNQKTTFLKLGEPTLLV